MEPRRTFFLSLFLFLASMVLYWPVAHYEFVYIDDNLYVTQNPWVQKGLIWANVKWALTSTYAFNWHPLTWLSHMLDYTLFGSFAGGHHLTNVVLHGVNAVILFLVCKRLTGAFWPSAMVAALFAWHPLHVESVAWVAERKDVLSTLFLLLTISAYARYCGAPTKWRYALTLMWFALGLMVKPMLVTLPCVLLLLDYWPLNRFADRSSFAQMWRSGWKLLLEKLPFFVLSFAACIITIVAQKDALKNLEDVPYTSRVLNSLTAYVDYLWATFVPVNLCVYYPLPTQIDVPKGIFSALILAGISYLVFRWRARFPWMVVGWLWFFGTLVPVIGLVQVGEQARADRYTYIPLIGLFIMIVWSADYWLQSRRRGSAFKYVIASISVISCLIITRYQLSFWQDNFTLFSRAIAVTDNNALAHQNLALALSHAERSAEAVGHYKAVLRVKPNNIPVRYDLGVELATLERTDEAIVQFSEVLKRGGRSEKAHNNLGVLLSQKGKLEDAIHHFKQAIELNPNFPEPYMNYALTLQKQGRAGDAAANYAKAIELNPDFPEALSRFGFLLATGPTEWRNPGEAVKLAKRATEITRHKLEYRLEILAAIYAIVGNYSEAVTTAELSRERAQKKGLTLMVKRLDHDLQIYKAQQSPPRDWKNPI